jgi:protein tyrosine/serine phosphatase
VDRWIDLQGAANVRDLGGLTTSDGRAVQPNRLIRSDNLQELTAADVHRLVVEHGVRAVADLRSAVEVAAEGPGPLTTVDEVRIEHLSLFPEVGDTTDAAAVEPDGNGPVVLPWQTEDGRERSAQRGASGVYLGYLDDRGDSIVAALRLIASSPGATLVHCAAGKDRTGVVVAMALAAVGVPRDQIVDDYVRSADRIEKIFARLAASSTYAHDLRDAYIDRHTPRGPTMDGLLRSLDEQYGGASAWLRAHGWTDEDDAALRHKLLDP